jgi:hypothetical protein
VEHKLDDLRTFKNTQVGQYGKKMVGSRQFRRFHGNSIVDRKIFGVFQPNFCSFWWGTAGSRRDNSTIFLPGLLLPFSINFQSFSAGKKRLFLSFPAGSGHFQRSKSLP